MQMVNLPWRFSELKYRHDQCFVIQFDNDDLKTKLSSLPKQSFNVIIAVLAT